MVFKALWPRLSKKYTEGYDERQGQITDKKIALLGGQKPLWFHCVSVGEVQSAVPIIKAARSSGYRKPIILSTTTETGKTMALSLAQGLFDFHLYYPWDRADFVASALDLLSPKCFVTMETELWPNMLWALRDRNIPAFLANGRISDRTYSRFSNMLGKKIGKEIYSLFTELFLKDELDKLRLSSLGINESKLSVVGDTKIDAILSRRDKTKIDVMREMLGISPNELIFTAGSTHSGEDEEILTAFNILREQHQHARLIIVPRHPERALHVRDIFSDYNTVLMSEVSSSGWDVLVVDKIGVLFDLYGLSTAAFVGGSFSDNGGQNIVEPASWGIPIQYGPHMEDFAAASHKFLEIGIAHQVKNGAELGYTWCDIAKNQSGRSFETKSKEYFEKESGAAKRIWTSLLKYVDV